MSELQVPQTLWWQLHYGTEGLPTHQCMCLQERIQEIEFGGGPGSFCRGGCRIGGSRAQAALKMFSPRAHYTCRFHVLVWVGALIFSRHYSAIWTEFISFSHAIGFCFNRAISCFAFPAHALVSSGPHPSDYARGLSPCALSLLTRRVSHETSHSFQTFSPRWKLHQSSDRHVQLLRMQGR